MKIPWVGNNKGIWAALSSAFLLGFAPIFGKQAINLGFSPLAVAALRTSMAAGILFILLTIFKRSSLFIYPAGLLGCILAGAINGIGSLFYYLAIERLGVSIGQLLFSLYPVFLIMWFLIERTLPSRLTFLRLFLSIIGVILITSFKSLEIDWLGVGLMLAASCLYAVHLPINQRVLYDVPPPTVTLYTLLAMSAVTAPLALIFGSKIPSDVSAWQPLFFMTIVMVLSRLLLFMGVKHLGGIQTALLGISELLVSLLISYFWLGETLQPIQWVGSILLFISILLISAEKIRPETYRTQSTVLLRWLTPPDSPGRTPWGPDQ